MSTGKGGSGGQGGGGGGVGLANPSFPPGQVVPWFIAGHPNAGPTLHNPVMGKEPYNGKTGPESTK